MATYIRFHTRVSRNESGRALGIFYAAGTLDNHGRIAETYREHLNETLGWFNEHLRVPRLAETNRNAVFWFVTDRQRHIAKLWDIVAILKEHDVDLVRLRTTDPGLIVYRDEYQIAATPNRRVYQTLRV